jgi:hypothetical protein
MPTPSKIKTLQHHQMKLSILCPWALQTIISGKSRLSPKQTRVLPIENNNQVPSTPVESFPQTDMVVPIQFPTTLVETFSQVPPIEVSTTPVETFSQKDEVLPFEVPTAPSSQLFYRDHVLTDIQEEDVEISVTLIDKPILLPSQHYQNYYHYASQQNLLTTLL